MLAYNAVERTLNEKVSWMIKNFGDTWSIVYGHD